MEVTEQPLTFVADKSLREVALLAPGLRVTMTGAEALALWTELGDMLKAVYGTRPDGLAAAKPGEVLQERPPTPSALNLSKEVAVDRLIRGIIGHAQKPDAKTHSESGSVPQSAGEPPSSSGVVGRAFGMLTRR